jgi:lysozyme family protein
MADPIKTIQKTLIHEGGYVDNPADSGGPTNMGITQKDMPGVDLKNLTAAQATEYYQQNYWKPLYSQIVDQLISEKIFDMGVLLGVGTATRALQIALGLNTVDGLFGPDTLERVNRSEPISFLAGYKTSLVAHVVKVVADNPKDRVFFAGWVRRINS